MIINLVPDFLDAADALDPLAAYHRYFRAYEEILRPYWHNYVVDADDPLFDEIAHHTLSANRSDLRATLAQTDIVALARLAEERARALLDIDTDFDIVLMVGVGAANAGELVSGGRGTAFVCLEHFTGVANKATHGLGLEPELIPMWLAHEIAHVVRYTSPTSQSEMRAALALNGGNYSYWDSARHATLRELLVNEGLAVTAARLVSPGHATWEYFGYERREFAAIRDAERTIARAAEPDLDRAGLGLRLRFLSGGMSTAARTVRGVAIPSRAGYFLGARLVESAVARHGMAWAVRAAADELTAPVAEARIA